MNSRLTLTLLGLAAVAAVLLPETASAYDGTVLKDQISTFDTFISSGAARIGLGLVAVFVTVAGAIKQSPALIGIAVLCFVFLYVAQNWINATYTLLI